jgi:hypothetical protein
MIIIRFNVGCPDCGTLQQFDNITNGQIDGSVLHECTKCRAQMVVAWSLEVQADVYKCADDPSDVEVNFSLSESWDEEG